MLRHENGDLQRQIPGTQSGQHGGGSSQRRRGNRPVSGRDGPRQCLCALCPCRLLLAQGQRRAGQARQCVNLRPAMVVLFREGQAPPVMNPGQFILAARTRQVGQPALVEAATRIVVVLVKQRQRTFKPGSCRIGLAPQAPEFAHLP